MTTEIKKVSTKDEILEVLSNANESKTQINTGDASLPGLYLDRTDMNKIIKIDETNMFAVIEWGVTFEQLKKEIESKNLTIQYPITSTSDLILESFSNYNVFFGNMRHKINQIANLQVILPNGKIYQTGASSLSEDNYWREDGGPNLHKMFMGSEEAFGIISKGTVLLYPKINKILIGFEFDDLLEAISITKSIARLEHSEEILLLNKASFKKRFNEECAKEWCILLNFNEKYYEIEKKTIMEKHNINDKMIDKDLNPLKSHLEKNWRDLDNYSKLSFYTLFQNCETIHNTIKNQMSSFICEIVPIEFGRTVYFQYFFEKDESLLANLRKELVDSNLCIFREITPETMKIIEKNQYYYQNARNIKKILDRNNILNPKEWLGGV
jgi:hypothetical protein